MFQMLKPSTWYVYLQDVPIIKEQHYFILNGFIMDESDTKLQKFGCERQYSIMVNGAESSAIHHGLLISNMIPRNLLNLFGPHWTYL